MALENFVVHFMIDVFIFAKKKRTKKLKKSNRQIYSDHLLLKYIVNGPYIGMLSRYGMMNYLVQLEDDRILIDLVECA